MFLSFPYSAKDEIDEKTKKSNLRHFLWLQCLSTYVIYSIKIYIISVIIIWGADIIAQINVDITSAERGNCLML